MTTYRRPPNPRSARPGAPAPPNPDAVAPMGRVRRSQAITTYGIGAIVDLPSGSVMPMGLDDWDSTTRGARLAGLTIYEPRLQAQLGVDHFRLPPTVEELNPRENLIDRRYSVPCVRFPEWHECPKCNRLGVHDDPFTLKSDGNILACARCANVAVNPVRFVVACDRGHLFDFPWSWWAHRNREGGACQQPILYLRSHKKSSALADLYVQCATCKSAKSMGDAFSGESLRALKCSGFRPWLRDRERDCAAKPRALQRGASNVHFPVIASALSIPPVSEPYFQLLDDHWAVIRSVPEGALEPVLRGLADQYGVDAAALKRAFDDRMRIETGQAARSDLASRAEEHSALCQTRRDESVAGRPPQFCNEVLASPPPIDRWFDLIGAVSRLREVRAATAFSRIEPYPVSGERILEALDTGRLSPLSQTRKNWFPAAEIRGEGIFMRFRTDEIDRWIFANPVVLERADMLDRRSASVAAERKYERDYRVTARLLLVHSFAHAMIRQLSMDCGYSSSALRERLFVSDDDHAPMNAVLIYTGSPDSEGSLGGLVRLAAPDLIADAVTRAIRHARWCGSDPVCRETDPAQSGDRISGAACHCCLLVPETACERFNRELDRTMLVGDADGRWNGFFSGLGEERF